MSEGKVRSKRILIAGIGNIWLGDDGFGCEVIKRIGEHELPKEIQAGDFGAGGLDLAYELQHGFDALVMVDVTRQGGEPGTVYLMEIDEDSVSGAVEDGDAINPHSMDPESVLKFIKIFGGWPGKVFLIGCEPSDVENMGIGLSEPVAAAVEPAVEAALKQAEELRHDAAYAD